MGKQQVLLPDFKVLIIAVQVGYWLETLKNYLEALFLQAICKKGIPRTSS